VNAAAHLKSWTAGGSYSFGTTTVTAGWAVNRQDAGFVGNFPNGPFSAPELSALKFNTFSSRQMFFGGVTQQVADCKASAARLGVHGIGQCVSQFANQHGKAVSDAHKASAARENGNGHANGHANDKSKDKPHGQGPSKSQSTQPSTSADREPTDQPNTLVVSIPPQR